jgi:hypothetical protein
VLCAPEPCVTGQGRAGKKEGRRTKALRPVHTKETVLILEGESCDQNHIDA